MLAWCGPTPQTSARCLKVVLSAVVGRSLILASGGTHVEGSLNVRVVHLTVFGYRWLGSQGSSSTTHLILFVGLEALLYSHHLLIGKYFPPASSSLSLPCFLFL